MPDRTYGNLMVFEVILVVASLVFGVAGYCAFAMAILVPIAILFWYLAGVPVDMAFDALKSLDELHSKGK